MPPMTTKSTPRATRRRRISSARSSARGARDTLGPSAEPAEAALRGLERLETLGRSELESGPDLALVETRADGRRLERKALTGGSQRRVQRLDAGVGARALEPRDGRLSRGQTGRKLGLAEAGRATGVADDGARRHGHSVTAIAYIRYERDLTHLPGRARADALAPRIHLAARARAPRPGVPYPLRARGGRAAACPALAGLGAVPPRAGGHGGRELLDRDPAAERDGLAAYGTRAERRDPGRAHPSPPHARPAHEVDLRHRSRRDRHADPGRAAPGGGGHEPGGDRARGLHPARLGMA